MAAQGQHRNLASIEEVSAYFQLPVKTLHDQRHRRVEIGALAFRVGRHLRWSWDDIDAYVAAQRRNSA